MPFKRRKESMLRLRHLFTSFPLRRRMSSTSRTPASEAATERLAWDTPRLTRPRRRRWFVIAELNIFPSLITSARLAFTLPASLSLHSLPSQSFSWLHLAPFLSASFERKLDLVRCCPRLRFAACAYLPIDVTLSSIRSKLDPSHQHSSSLP
jgi:hypothetical protein